MISLSSIWAIALRHLRMFKRDPNLMLMALYWPLLDVVIWGSLGVWMQQSQPAILHNYKEMALFGVLLWQVVGRGCNQMMLSFTEEFVPNNVVNLFSLPLHMIEWMLGSLLFTSIMIGISTSCCMLFITYVYDVPFWYLMTTFLMFAPPLFFSAIWIGFTCLQIVVTLGRRGIELGFVIGWFLMPFSGAYYPVEVLPAWGQTLSSWLPMSYVFQGMRQYVMYQQDPTSYLLKGYGLGILYAMSAVMLFMYCFNRSKRQGLARLAD